MATLIALSDKFGNRRQCNATCYLAAGEMCTCICGGRNHGVGMVAARNNIYEQGEQLLRDAELLFDGPFQWTKCCIPARQMELPL